MTLPEVELAGELKRIAIEQAGFACIGIAPAVTPDGFHPLLDWLDNDYAGEMAYLDRRREAYRHPDSVLNGVRSVIMLGFSYRTETPQPTGPNLGRISRYAWGTRDYHDALRDRIAPVSEFLHQHRPRCRTRVVIDTAPLLERDFARLAGLGWFGKNTMLLTKTAGSDLFLVGLLTDVELPADAPFETDHCGTCTRCLDICPTEAFPQPGVLDARRCISYLTIELKGPIPSEHRAGIGEWVFGCDLCTDVCPWNSKAKPSPESSFVPLDDRNPCDLRELLMLSEEAFRQRFRKTPLARPKWRGLLRNAAITLGNVGDAEAFAPLVRCLAHDEPLVRGASAWAIGRLVTRGVVTGSAADAELKSRLASETDPEVKTELRASLAVVSSPIDPAPTDPVHESKPS